MFASQFWRKRRMKNLSQKPAAPATETALQGNYIPTKGVTKESGYTVGRMEWRNKRG
jgi:hypothetical protein